VFLFVAISFGAWAGRRCCVKPPAATPQHEEPVEPEAPGTDTLEEEDQS